MGKVKSKSKMYGRHNKWIRRQLIREHGAICGLCEKPILRMKDATIDHIVPLAKGGTDEYENMQLAHYDCNQEKGCMSPEEFRLWQGEFVT